MSGVPPESPPPRVRAWKRRGFVPLLVVVLVVFGAIAAWYFWPTRGAATQARNGKPSAEAKGRFGGRGAKGGFDANRPQPVAVAPARVGDIDVVQTALGTVTSGQIATVRPRVDGLLQDISFVEGQIVAAGAKLAQIDPMPFEVQLQQVEGQLARDSAQLANARVDLDRYRTLLAQDSIASQQVDQQAALVRQLEGTVKVDQAQVANAKLQLSYTRITAPIAGRLGLRQVDPGNMIHTTDANGIVVITQVDPIGIVFTIPQEMLPRVLARIGHHDKLAVEAWSTDGKTLLGRGFLLTTDNVIDVATGTVKLKAMLPNRDGKLFPNQFVNVRMVVDTVHDAVLVPTAAIQRNAAGQFVVYVVKNNDTVTVRPITTGPTEGLDTAVEKGVAAGERVVTDGVDRIREGSKVEVTSPAATHAPPPAPGPENGKKGGKTGGKATGEKRGLFHRKSQGQGGGGPGGA